MYMHMGKQKKAIHEKSYKLSICCRDDFLNFLMPIKPLQQNQNTKIRSLLLTKLFKLEVWKGRYFCDLVTFWWWKSSLKKLNFRALAINQFWTKWHGTKNFWPFLITSNPCSIRFEIKNHWCALVRNVLLKTAT